MDRNLLQIWERAIIQRHSSHTSPESRNQLDPRGQGTHEDRGSPTDSKFFKRQDEEGRGFRMTLQDDGPGEWNRHLFLSAISHTRRT